MDNAPLRSHMLPNKKSIPSRMPLVRGDNLETQNVTGCYSCFLLPTRTWCQDPIAKTPNTLLTGLGEMVLMSKLPPCRLAFIGALMTDMTIYAHRFNTSINIMETTNQYLIGFNTYSTGGNPFVVLWVWPRTHGWWAHRPQQWTHCYYTLNI